jgi:hypothetical protein
VAGIWPAFLEGRGAEDPRGVVADEGRGEPGIVRGRGFETRNRFGGQFQVGGAEVVQQLLEPPGADDGDHRGRAGPGPGDGHLGWAHTEIAGCLPDSVRDLVLLTWLGERLYYLAATGTPPFDDRERLVSTLLHMWTSALYRE